MKVFIIGTGLIGGSFALDIQQEYSEAIIYGIDTKFSTHIKEALECGVIHEEASFEDLQLCADHGIFNNSCRCCLKVYCQKY